MRQLDLSGFAQYAPDPPPPPQPDPAAVFDGTLAQALNNDFIGRQQELLYDGPDASHFNGLRGEYGLANDIAEHFPDETVVEFGRKAGERGPDVISVNRDGEVIFWDSKWRSVDTSISRWTRAHKTDQSFKDAVTHAEDSIRQAVESGRLSPKTGNRALENLRNRNATVVTVGTGSARNGVIEQIVGGNRTIVHP
jgi:hypothetical protein